MKDMPVREYKKESPSDLRKKIKDLFDRAEQAATSDLEYASSLVRRARIISLATRVKIPSELKRRFCKQCGAYLVSGKNARVRTQRGKVVTTCLSCKYMSRIPYTLEKKIRRRASQKK